MPALSFMTVLTTAWASVTLIFIVLMAYKSLVGLKEEDTLILSAGESSLREEQKAVQTRLARIQPYVRGFGWASVALLVIIAAIWVYRGVQNLLA